MTKSLRPQYLEQAIWAHKLSTKKASRLRRQGVEVTGSAIDPRQPLDVVRGMTTRQLKRYIRDQHAFLDRKVQFVPGRNRTPLSREKWLRYKELEAKRNIIANRQFERLKDVKLPGSSVLTIGNRRGMRDVAQPQMVNNAANTPYRPVERVSLGVKSDEALDKLIDMITYQQSEEYTAKQLVQARIEFGQMADFVGMSSFVGDINRLDNDEFGALWFETDFAEQFSALYESAKKMLSPADQAVYEQLSNDVERDFGVYTSWAKNAGQVIKAGKNAAKLIGALKFI